MCSEIHIANIGTSFRATIKDQNNVVVDISSGSGTMYFYKPDGSVLTKTATLVSGGTYGQMEYITQSGDLDTTGLWSIQGYIIVGASEWYTNIHNFKVYDNLN